MWGFHISKRKYLKSSAIRKDREIDIHERMESAEMRDSLITRTEIEMVGVREHDLAPDLHDMIFMDPLHARLGSDRHENGGLYIPMRSRECSGTCESVGGFQSEIKHKNTVLL